MQSIFISSPIWFFFKIIIVNSFCTYLVIIGDGVWATFISNYQYLLPCEATSLNMTPLASLHPLIHSSPGDKKCYIFGRRNRAWNGSPFFFPLLFLKGQAEDSQYCLYFGWYVWLLLKSCAHKFNLPNRNRPSAILLKNYYG